MRVFKQFKVGEIDYELSYETYMTLHKYSTNRAFLRIISICSSKQLVVQIPRRFEPRKSGFATWTVRIHDELGHAFINDYIKDEHKAQEVRRLIMLFLTNQL